MANIKIQSLPKIGRKDVGFVYADLRMDLKLEHTDQQELEVSNEKKDVSISYDLAALRNSIINIFTTSPGEKILNPEFGLDLRDFVFEPVNDFTTERIKERIRQGLKKQEPRIEFEKEPIVIPNEDANEYTIEIVISSPSLEISGLLLRGLLGERGFTVV